MFKVTVGFIILVLIFFPKPLFSSEPVKIDQHHIFQLQGMQQVYGIISNRPGTFVIASTTNAMQLLSRNKVTNGNNDIRLFEVNSQGKVLWDNIYGGMASDQIKDILLNENQIAFVGTTWSSERVNHGEVMGMPVSAPKGSYTRIINTNNDGKIIWDKIYDNYAGYDFSLEQKITKSNDGGYIVASEIQDSWGASEDIRIFEIDNNGNKKWDERWSTNNKISLVGIGTSNDGGYILVGESDNGWGAYSTWVLKISKVGKIVWNKNVSEAKQNFSGSNLGSMVMAKNDDILIAGSFRDRSRREAWVLRLNDKGDVLWEHRYPVEDYNVATCIIQVNDGGFIIGGDSKSSRKNPSQYINPWVIKIDGFGREQWRKLLQGERNAALRRLLEIDQSRFVLVGEIEEASKKGEAPNNDIWFMVLEGG